jgi:hypothetical protein
MEKAKTGTEIYPIPVDVIAAASQAIRKGRLSAQIIDGKEQQGVVIVKLTYNISDDNQGKAIDNILDMIKEYNDYRFGNEIGEVDFPDPDEFD